MKPTRTDPVLSWFGLTLFLVAAFGLLTGNYFLVGFAEDNSRISLLILALFIFGLIRSFQFALLLKNEWRVVSEATDSKNHVAENDDKGLRNLISRIALASERHDSFQVTNIVDAYNTRTGSAGRAVRLYSAVLITLGLLGTIAGLIETVGGLEEVIQNVGNSRSDLTAGLRTVIKGMATAFYTTFFGALFGGVVLRLLAANQLNSLEELCAQAVEHIELTVLPSRLTSEHGEQLAKSMKHLADTCSTVSNELSISTSALNSTLQSFQAAVGHAESHIRHFSATLLDTRLNAIAEQLENCAQSLRDSLNSVAGRSSADDSGADA